MIGDLPRGEFVAEGETMFGFSREDGQPSLLGGTIKSVVIVGALSFLAAGWLSTATHDNETLSRLAFNASKGRDDPLTTGSISGRANATRVDPCVTPRR